MESWQIKFATFWGEKVISFYSTTVFVLQRQFRLYHRFSPEGRSFYHIQLTIISPYMDGAFIVSIPFSPHPPSYLNKPWRSAY